MCEKFQVGESYYPQDRSYDPITVIRRTPKCIVVRGGSGNEWRMVVRHDRNRCEFVTDSCVPKSWRFVFTYFANEKVMEG